MAQARRKTSSATSSPRQATPGRVRGVLQERLLRILERKDHWAWPWFAEGRVPLQRLRPHFQQEWAVYVRDFPQLLARVMGHSNTPQDVRAMLAANIYEEQTGGISGTTSHPELFLRMMEGCGFSRSDFGEVELLPAANRDRTFLDEIHLPRELSRQPRAYRRQRRAVPVYR